MLIWSFLLIMLKLNKINTEEIIINIDTELMENSKPYEESNKNCTFLKSIDRFRHLWLSNCPINFDANCEDPIFDPNQVFEFRCGSEMLTVKVHNLTSAAFLDLISKKNPSKKNFCMITMFYSHNCIFSHELSKFYNQLPDIYENLIIVAVDVAEFTNFRYGISGTPTVLLWFNGHAVARMENEMLNLTGLTKFIESHTDLLALKKKKPRMIKFVQRVGNEVIEDVHIAKGIEIMLPKNQSVYNFLSWLFCLSICLTTLIYHYRETLLQKPAVVEWFKNRFGSENCERIYYLLYSEVPRNEGGQHQEIRGFGRWIDELVRLLF